MADLAWSWLALPYAICTVLLLSVCFTAALLRGDRVLRLGVIAAASAAVPWAMCQAFAACTHDPSIAKHLIRLGQGPIAAVGPSLLLVLLGLSGQLERHRWVARMAAMIGAFFFAACWATDWVVPDVQVLSSGMFYMAPGPITGLSLSQLVLWLVVGVLLTRRATPRAERKGPMRMLLGVLVVGAIGSLDTLLLYRIWGGYPIAWLVACVASVIALNLCLRTDFLRPQGFDLGAAMELGLFTLSAIIIAGLAFVLGTADILPLVALAAIGWGLLTGFSWALAQARPTRIQSERELEQFVASVPTFDAEKKIDERLASLWKRAVGIDIRTVWWRDGDAFTQHDGTRWTLHPDVITWLVQVSEPVAALDLATMRLGPLRPTIEAFAATHNPDLIVPLCDRGELVGLVEASFDKALREAERALVAESARAAARALTFVALGRIAARERETARQVEVADALRLQASVSREAQFGAWAVAAEYRTAPRTTGAGWSAIELSDGRLALLVTEAQAHGVAAALATAAITGAFAAATAGSAAVTLDELLRTMRASSEGVLRGGEPVAAFLAIVDAQAEKIDWACAGHPGAFLIGPIASMEGLSLTSSHNMPPPKVAVLSGGPRVRGASLHAAHRAEAKYSRDWLLVVASTALRGDDEAKCHHMLVELARTSGRLATALVERALSSGEPAEDLLAVVARSR